jgi:hypothetical protein
MRLTTEKVLKERFDFLLELDRLKSVVRQSYHESRLGAEGGAATERRSRSTAGPCGRDSPSVRLVGCWDLAPSVRG